MEISHAETSFWNKAQMINVKSVRKILKVQKGFPMGLPLVRKMESDLWEIRVTISKGICRIFFTVKEDIMILLHGFVKKTQKTPEDELKTAKQRLHAFMEMNR